MTIYDNILRLQQLSGDFAGSNVTTYAARAREAIVARADQALEIIAIHGTFADLINEVKDEAARIEEQLIKLNGLLTAMIREEANRMLGSAG